MEAADKGCPMTRMGVSGWVFLLVLAYPGSPGPTVVCVGVWIWVGQRNHVLGGFQDPHGKTQLFWGGVCSSLLRSIRNIWLGPLFARWQQQCGRLLSALWQLFVVSVIFKADWGEIEVSCRVVMCVSVVVTNSECRPGKSAAQSIWSYSCSSRLSEWRMGQSCIFVHSLWQTPSW